MSKLRCHISISADGFVAGPNQSEENPLGEGGERLHDWAVSLAAWRESHDKQGGKVNESTRIMEETLENVGAGIMGRNMFGPVGGGDWGDEQWKGWWGDDPPYHNDVFILTRHPREPVEMEGARRSTSSPTGSSGRWSGRRSPRTVRTSGSGAAPRSFSSTWRRGSWTSWSSTSFRCCSGTALASSTTSGAPRSSFSRSGRSRRPASRTSSTG
jgi:dihydrofolate reductase